MKLVEERKSIFNLGFDTLINLVHVRVIRSSLTFSETNSEDSQAQHPLCRQTGMVLYKINDFVASFNHSLDGNHVRSVLELLQEEPLRGSNESYLVGMKFVEKVLYSLFGCDRNETTSSLCDANSTADDCLSKSNSSFQGLFSKLEQHANCSQESPSAV